MTGTTRNFLGIPVQGDITEASTRVPQKPLEELQPLLQAVLDDPTITEFGWRQYTPYFNDGDPCVFSAHGLWVRTTQNGADDDLDVDYNQALGKRPRPFNPRTMEFTTKAYEGPDEARYDRCQELNKAIQSGAFDNVLLDAFGDHAHILIRSDGIEVEFYEHD